MVQSAVYEYSKLNYQGNSQDFKKASPTIARLFGNPSPTASTPPTHMLVPRSAWLVDAKLVSWTYEEPLDVRPRLKSAAAMVNTLLLNEMVTA